MTALFPPAGAPGAFHRVYITAVNCRGLVPPRLGTRRDADPTPSLLLASKAGFAVDISLLWTWPMF